MHIDLGIPYLTQQAITYLGNKRKHLDIIDAAVTKIIANDPQVSRRLAGGTATAADPFSGSGVVGRLLRARQFKVYANDVAHYTHPINTAWLTIEPAAVEKLFEAPAKWLARRMGLKAKKSYYYFVLDVLNSLEKPSRQYFSRYYAPNQTASPCMETERLFYTQENARRLDCWMELLHEQYWMKHKQAWSMLVASVLHQMTTNINTSGTMKAFHRGWGGPHGDALGRIMAPMKIQPLPLTRGPEGVVSCTDAREIPSLPEGLLDITYLDPPGHQQQYSSNYHLLTSFCDNGTFNPGPVAHGTRAGIPPDHFRSQYSKSRAASYEMSELVDYWSARSRYIVCTYDSNGLLSYEELFKILQNEGDNKVDFLKYGDGGKETLFLVKTSTKVSTVFHEVRSTKLAATSEALSLKDKYVCPEKLLERFKLVPTRYGWAVYDNVVKLFSIRYDYKILAVNISSYDSASALAIQNALLSKPDLIAKYISESHWTRALKVVASMKSPRERLAVQTFLKEIYTYAHTKTDDRLLHKIDILCGKMLRSTALALFGQIRTGRRGRTTAKVPGSSDALMVKRETAAKLSLSGANVN